MPPLKAYSFDIVGSMTGVAVFTVLSAAGTPPFVWFGSLPSWSSLWAWAPDFVASSAGHRSVPRRASSALVVVSTPPNQTWSPVLPDRRIPRPAASERSTSTASRTRRCGRSTEMIDPFYEQVYRWFPDRTFDRRPDRRRRVRHGRGRRAGARARARRRRRDRPEDPGDRRPSTIRTARTTTRGSPAIIDDGRAFLRRRPSRVRPRHLRPARFADPRQHVREPPARVVPVHLGGVRRGPRPPRPDGVFVLYNYYREDWLPQKIGGHARGRASAARRSSGCTAAPPRRLAAGPLIDVARRRPAARRRRRLDRPRTERPRRGATDDWPFLYLQDAVHRAVLHRSRSSIIIAFAVLLVGRAAQRSGTSLRAVQPALLRARARRSCSSRPRASRPSACSSGRPGSSTALVFFAVLASVLAGDLRQPSCALPEPGAAVRGALRVARARGRAAAGIAADRADLAPLRRWRRRSPSRRSSSPTSSSATRSATPRRPTWPSRRTCSVPSSAAAIEYVALISGYGWLLGDRRPRSTPPRGCWRRTCASRSRLGGPLSSASG